MIIKSLRVIDFRCFNDTRIDFHPGLTVLVANNGGGKTAILDAIAIALSPYTKKFEHGSTANFHREDAHLRRLDLPYTDAVHGSIGVKQASERIFPVTLAAELEHNDTTIPIKRILGSAKGRTTTKEAKGLELLAAEKIEKIRESSAEPLPVVAYYGTGRLYQQKRLTLRKTPLSVDNPTSRTMGYLDCLSPDSSYKHFAEWMKRTTFANAEEIDNPSSVDSERFYANLLQGVREPIDSMLASTGWKGLRYRIYTDELTVSETQRIIPVTSLSDGIRNILSLAGDLAYRCVMLNPAFGANAAKMTSGIVMIDEVDMHLHPSWQQTIITDLQRTFPNIQFIVTTHSPQVLSTVRPESIRIINNYGTITDGSEADFHSFGARSNAILNDIMGVSASPKLDKIETLKDTVKELIRDGQLTLEHPNLKSLESFIGDSDPFIINTKATLLRQSK